MILQTLYIHPDSADGVGFSQTSDETGEVLAYGFKLLLGQFEIVVFDGPDVGGADLVAALRKAADEIDEEARLHGHL